MKQLIILTISLLLMTACSSTGKINYPATAKNNVVEKYFGVEVAEPYRWLENDTSSATKAWVVAQNDVTYKYLDQIPFRAGLKNG